MTAGFDSSDEIEGVVIHSSTTPERLCSACRTGNLKDVDRILGKWPKARPVPHEALLEAVVWSRVDIVRRLLDSGVSTTNKGTVLAPGGSGVSYSDCSSVSGLELSGIMVGAGHRPQRAQTIRRLIQTRRSSKSATATATANTSASHSENPKVRRVSKRPARYEAGPSERPSSKRLRRERLVRERLAQEQVGACSSTRPASPVAIAESVEEDEDDEDDEPEAVLQAEALDEASEQGAPKVRRLVSTVSTIADWPESEAQTTEVEVETEISEEGPPRALSAAQSRPRRGMPTPVLVAMPVPPSREASLVRRVGEPIPPTQVQVLSTSNVASTSNLEVCSSSTSTSSAAPARSRGRSRGDGGSSSARDAAASRDVIVEVVAEATDEPLAVQCNTSTTSSSSASASSSESSSNPQEILALQKNVRELQEMVAAQGRLIKEQSVLLQSLYAAGTAAAVAYVNKVREPGGRFPAAAQ